MNERYRIELFGGLRVWRAGKAIDRFPTVKSALLLAYLAAAASGTRPHVALPRDDLAGLFWPESIPERARPSLRQALVLLRRLLAGTDARVPLFLADRASVRLNPDCFCVDVAEFEAALRAAEKGGDTGDRRRRLVEALRLYRGELLAGYADTWLLTERMTLAERYFTALRRLLALLEAAGDLEAAIAWAREGLRQDPLREELHRDLMRLLAAAGEPEAALRQYGELSRLLRMELDGSPNATTQALVRTIQQGLAGVPSSMGFRLVSLRLRVGGPAHDWNRRATDQALSRTHHSSFSLAQGADGEYPFCRE